MAAALNIVVVEDHDMLREATVTMLRAHGHRVQGVTCAEEVDELSTALDRLLSDAPDLYVIDLSLPGEDGLSLARRLRHVRAGVGIVMATARTQLEDRINGYDHGADIYLPKPVAPDELLAAVNALGHRIKPPSDEDALELDMRRRQVTGPNGAVALSAAEAQLLLALAQASLQTLERWQVAVHLGLDTDDAPRANVDVRLSQLRKKLRDAGAPESCLQAIRNVGYRLCVAITAQ